MVLKTEANSSNLDLTNQCWYNPANAKKITQYKYTIDKGIKKLAGTVVGIHPDSTLNK